MQVISAEVGIQAYFRTFAMIECNQIEVQQCNIEKNSGIAAQKKNRVHLCFQCLLI